MSLLIYLILVVEQILTFDNCGLKLECPAKTAENNEILLKFQPQDTPILTGDQGVMGETGIPGVKGTDGLHKCSGIKSAFYAYDGLIPFANRAIEHRISFQKTSLNYGNHFDLYNSIYVAPVNGTYSFYVFVNGFLNTSTVSLNKGGTATVLSGRIENSIITGWYGSLKIYLIKGDTLEVVVKYRNDSQTFTSIAYGPFASFGGFLLNEQFD